MSALERLIDEVKQYEPDFAKASSLLLTAARQEQAELVAAATAILDATGNDWDYCQDHSAIDLPTTCGKLKRLVAALSRFPPQPS